MSRRSMLAIIALLVGSLAAGSLAAAPALAQEEEGGSEEPPPEAEESGPVVIALTGGTVLQGDQDPVEDATIVIREGVIRSIDPGGPVPSGARVVDCAGMTITPGFIGTETPIGLVEIDLEPSTVDAALEGDDADPVRASFGAVDGYNPTSTLIPVARRWGVTSALSTPSGGLISGTSAWVDLAGASLDDALVEDSVALHINLTDGGVSSSGGARSSALGRLREAFDDARLYQQGRAIYNRRGLRELSMSRRDLERLVEALGGSIPTVVRVARSSDILRVLSLAQEYDLDLVLSGAEEAHLVATQIAAADVPVILRPMTNLPAQFSQLHARYDNAAILERAGIEVIITTDGAHTLRNLRQEAGNAIATGMTRQAALAALTTTPAAVFNQETAYGGIARGRVANLVVWTGDPFELTTWARNVFIRGREISTRSRQTMLFERYRTLDNVRRGRRGLPRVQPSDRTPSDDHGVERGAAQARQ